MTPAPVATADTHVLNEIARQAGAHPITLPSENPSSAPTSGSGEVSPTGVAEISIYPSWTDAKEPPSWYAKGADVDALLDVAGSLDWLADSGDANENFTPPEIEGVEDMPEVDVSPSKLRSEEIEDEDADVQAANYDTEEEQMEHNDENHQHLDDEQNNHLTTISSSAELPQTMDDSNMDEQVPPLPSFFDGAPDSHEQYEDVHGADRHGEDAVVNHSNIQASHESNPRTGTSNSASAVDLLMATTASSTKLTLHEEDEHGAAVPDSHHSVDGELGDATLFDSEMEHDFVSTILENSESTADLTALHD